MTNPLNNGFTECINVLIVMLLAPKSVSFPLTNSSRIGAQRRVRCARSRRAVAVRANQQPDRQNDVAATRSSTIQHVLKSLEAMLRRYDFVSAGVGALAVTTVCVARGQDMGTAVWITAASTVVALVANEMFCDAD